MSLVIDVYKGEGGKCKVEVRGRLDTHTASEFDQKLSVVDVSEFPVQALDLSGLSYVSSAGMRSLFKAKKRLADAGGQLLLVNPQPQVRKVFDIIKALPSSSIFANEEEMDRYLDAMQRKEQSI
mgnify:CR=1 FL=1